MIFLPDHPYADCKGFVLEHRFIMEQKLGRYLKPKEVVHHINKQTDDNSMDNLELFKDQGAHTRFHHTEKRNGNNGF